MKVLRTGDITLYHGDYRDALGSECYDCVITDPPYSERTHSGHNSGVNNIRDGAERSCLTYTHFTHLEFKLYYRWCCEHANGWVAIMNDEELTFELQFAHKGFDFARDRYLFSSVPCVSPGSRVRVMGDGPACWSVYLSVSRPKTQEYARWGALPGAYVYTNATQDKAVTGGKPLDMMRAIVRDYSRPGDLVCDPCAGAGTTLIAAAMEGRRAVGAEIDEATFEHACNRILSGVQKPLLIE